MYHLFQDLSLQRLFDRVISGKSAAGIQAEQLLQLEYFRNPVLENVPAINLPTPSTVVVQGTIPKMEPIIPDPNKPMEIGVFDVKDAM